MADELRNNLPEEIHAIIDSQNPPISIDSVMLSQGPSGIRICGLSHPLFPVRVEEVVKPDTNRVRLVWVRPSTVMDMNFDSTIQLFRSFVDVFVRNPANVESVCKANPGFAKILRQDLEDVITLIDDAEEALKEKDKPEEEEKP